VHAGVGVTGDAPKRSRVNDRRRACGRQHD
jgi:hypothetical protein